ncbi:MAG: tRNA (adenosine(37)-N6)-threonylcarbamoyltransferase complex ATPase subunit type 1 TsaE [Clostridia bacterium]|nr:tRNA (adenosine(37)-N6)-threonylcarbamoyltransferase complex ATPase subunit type 1 TsaE [Oscillospiraceae bacterium]MBQ7960064.1 tRNA (adenosine(37)-N6)-threonylcarbamoyltransferase complex ATPase subunit type 1 TsaE [Clostridia bacterium]
MKVFESCSEAETRSIAKKFAEALEPGSIIALRGDLGAGKTAFTKGIADYFCIDSDVSSPTFTIVNEYNGSLDLYHFDAYRLENVDPESCDWMDDYFFGDGVCIIEWAQNIEAVLPKGYFDVRIEKNPSKGEDYREILIEKTER